MTHAEHDCEVNSLREGTPTSSEQSTSEADDAFAQFCLQENADEADEVMCGKQQTAVASCGFVFRSLLSRAHARFWSNCPLFGVSTITAA